MTKRVIIIVVLSLLGTFSSVLLGRIWTNSVLSNFTFSEYYGLNTLVMSIWLPTIVIFMLIGVVLKRSFGYTCSYVWPFSLGAVSALMWLSIRTTIFVEEPGIADILWTYSELVMPVVGCMLGWFLAKTVNNSLCPGTPKRAGQP